ALQPDFQFGSEAFLITLTDQATGTQLSRLPTPLSIEYRLSAFDMNAAGGDMSRVRIALWNGAAWMGLACSPGSSSIVCDIPHLTLFAVVIAPTPSEPLEAPVANGWFYKEGNGFSGAGDFGYSVTDDGDAPMWTEFQRLGGIQDVGYPISGRFEYGGLITQVFQKLALQWHPELGQAVPLNVLDDLGARGDDAWLQRTNQLAPVPTPVNEAGMSPDELVAQRLSLLDPYPVLADFYAAQPDAGSRYGLPVSVNTEGSVVTVRFQRGILQLWPGDPATGASPTVTIGNAGDIARSAGLWPLDAIAPGPQPGVASTTLDDGEPVTAQ
ncbi:MAG TPA: hypothetical protein VFB50_03695, partial [Chloroflexota bacterium]|nr:hypothetical protein [Chloroflexota bacterium]